MKLRESSDEMSSLASRVMRMKPVEVSTVSAASYNQLLSIAKQLSGSVMSQDRTPGKRIKRAVAKIFGR